MVVSVIVPIYNSEPYLHRCVDSLIKQSYTRLQVILVDDGSTDGSGRICDEYATKDHRVKVVHKENGGEASARQCGLNAAIGDFIAFCDSDDEYVPDSIEKLALAMEKEDVDLCVGAYFEKSADVVKLACTMQQKYRQDEIISKILTDPNPYGARYIMSTVNGKLFKTSILREFDIQFDNLFVVGNDSLFVADYINHCHMVYDILSPSYIYYKYDINERQQGMSWLYPDQFKLTIAYYSKLKNSITSQLHQGIFDSLIKQLVIAAAYKEYLKNSLEDELTNVVNNSLIAEVVKNYHPERLSDSITIPKFFLERDVKNLTLEFCEKSELYLSRNGKQKYVRLMVKE